jgi:hypothetical protein
VRITIYAPLFSKGRSSRGTLLEEGGSLGVV